MHTMLKNELRDILALQKADDGGEWLDCLTLSHEQGTLTVGFPHMYFAAWFGRHKRAIFEQVLTCRFADDTLPQIVYEQPVIGHDQAARWRQIR
jgi:hypothetical protein